MIQGNLILGGLMLISLVALTQAATTKDLIGIWEKRSGANSLASSPRVVSDLDDERVTPARTVAPPGDLCQDPTFSTIVRSSEPQFYVFKGSYFWRLYPQESVEEPRLIADHWPELPDYPDASVVLKDGLTYFFKGNKFWAYDTEGDFNKLVKKGPLTDVLPGITGPIDAVDYYESNDVLYVYEGRRRHKLSSDGNTSVRTYKEVPYMHGLNRVIGTLNRGYGSHLVFLHDGTYAEDKFESRKDDAPRKSIASYFGCPQ